MACALPAKEKYERLPDNARPTHYNIHLQPNLETFDFAGRVDINVDILKVTSSLKVHSNSLNVTKINITQKDGNVLAELPHTYNEKSNMVEIGLPTPLEPQSVLLTIEFIGIHNDKMHGFYRSKYVNESGETHWMVSTQFESTYARSAFPCWDEPMYKATFDVTLTVDEQFTALSNNEAISDVVDGKKRTVKFATTPKMSTYLVAFAVGKFEYLENVTASGVRVRVYTVPNKKHLGEFALEVGSKAIEWYNEWFGIQYPLPKCDMIAIPDFSMGAMENWGLVTYREVALLYDAQKTSTKQKAYIALVIAHELAHLWFGDLVTMKWWTDLWLKEGFASFMEYLFVGYNYPEMQIWLHFLNDELGSGFNLDALRSSHPIEVEIDNPNELDEIYDHITYAKSNSINRMLCFYLGEETFQKGLRIYLQKFQYSNAETADLWESLQEASGQNVAELMSGWTKKMGYPVVSVSTLKQEGNKRTLKFSQERFLADGSVDETGGLWQVPITMSCKSAPSEIFHRFVLSEKEMVVEVEVKENDWVKVNSGTTGFYRVQYEEEMLRPLLVAVEEASLPVLDRFGLANDLFALVSSGKSDVSLFLHLAEASARGEREYAVWRTLDAGFSAISNVLLHADEDGSLVKRFNNYICSFLAPVGKSMGWTCTDGEDSQVSLLRALIQARLCKAGDETAIEAAKTLFNANIDEGKELHADLRLTVFGTAVRSGGSSEFSRLLHLFETCGFSEVEKQALMALSTTDPESGRLQELYDYSVHQGKVRSQDLYHVFVGCSATRAGQKFVWNFFKQNLDLLSTKFGGANNSLFQHCFKMSAEESANEEMAKEVETFFCGKVDATSLQTLDRPIKQVAEKIRNNVRLLFLVKNVLVKHLENKGL